MSSYPARIRCCSSQVMARVFARADSAVAAAAIADTIMRPEIFILIFADIHQIAAGSFANLPRSRAPSSGFGFGYRLFISFTRRDIFMACLASARPAIG